MFKYFKNRLLLITLCIGSNFFALADNGDPSKSRYLKPKENDLVYYENIELMWQSVAGAKVYHVLVSKSALFDNIVFEAVVKDCVVWIPSLSKYQDFFWKVLSISEDGKEEEYNERSFFRTSNILVTPQNETDEIKVLSLEIEDHEVLYFDNPELQEIQLTFYSNDQIYAQHVLRGKRQAIHVSHWPRKTYIVSCTTPSRHIWTKDITLD